MEKSGNQFNVREATELDRAAIVEMNNAAVPAVNALTHSTLSHLHQESDSLLVVGFQDRIAGFLLLLPGPGAQYESVNYRWFSDRYPSFLYVDRIVIDVEFRGHGLGTTLYQHSYEMGAGRFPVLCAEVNTRPRNEGSLRFHRRHGFGEVGEQDTEQGTKRVVLLSRDLAS